MASYPDRSNATQYAPAPRAVVDRLAARTAAWYEFFPRSAEGRGDRGSTLRDCLPRIDDAKAMGFDVIYFPPIHPIGQTNRKGRNNSITSEPGDPGSPWAIGSKAGGHKAIEPALGTLADFDWLVAEVRKRGMEIALDFALNCSPDHPYVKEHPDWFYKRPDGSIKYAENPPKKYEDIYPLNFRCKNWRALWAEMKSIILFWAEHGVRIFRVDNPHTKPVAFWEYLIANVQAKYPDVLFLSEAFTKPKMMKALAKAGFTQSYTYFTWRNSKQELIEYFTELMQPEMREYFRANLWPNTPDILPFVLQEGGRPAFMIRVRARRDALQPLRHLQRIRSCARMRRCLVARNISIPRNINSRSAIGTRRETSRTGSRDSIKSEKKTARCNFTTTCGSITPTTTPSCSTAK